MPKVTKSSPYWEALLELINAITRSVPLSMENQALIVYRLDTEEKIEAFFQWIESRLVGDDKVQATEEEIVRAAVHAHKGIL